MGHSTDSQIYACNCFSKQTMLDWELENEDWDSIVGYSLDCGNLIPIGYLNKMIDYIYINQ